MAFAQLSDATAREDDNDMTEMIPIKRRRVGIRTRANLEGSMVSGLTNAKK